VKVRVGDACMIDGVKLRVYKITPTHITFTTPDNKMWSMTIEEYERKMGE
jgi:hypothetical protein